MIEPNKIYNGDSSAVLKTFPSDSIDCCITSPPYYALRDYGVEGQLGLEKTFHEYIEKLLTIFDEVKRVLKPSGTCWVNLGDSYSGSGNGTGDKNLTGNRKEVFEHKKQKPGKQIQDKCLLQIPSRFSIGMTDRGWILRNEIIWYKRNCMPSSVKDRFTVDFEKIYFFTKSKKYYFEQVFEAHTTPEKERYRPNPPQSKTPHSNNLNLKPNQERYYKQGRNKRCVWDVTTKPYKEAHFATYPEDLVKPMIQAGCPEFVCVKCGKAKEKTYERINTGNWEYRKQNGATGGSMVYGNKQQLGSVSNHDLPPCVRNVIGYSSCNCNAEFTGGVVLDIFAGSGTTLKVAKDLNRNYIGIELNPEYIKLIEKRLEKDKLKLAL